MSGLVFQDSIFKEPLIPNELDLLSISSCPILSLCLLCFCCQIGYWSTLFLFLFISLVLFMGTVHTAREQYQMSFIPLQFILFLLIFLLMSFCFFFLFFLGCKSTLTASLVLFTQPVNSTR